MGSDQAGDRRANRAFTPNRYWYGIPAWISSQFSGRLANVFFFFN
ncbi:hypothetical protein NC651_020960 [Populus alba x Populus x berolinensis]|nr:hypothetical protein NC651_020951 [Populus alba x Populus x berolinensis]KAJ6903636.1 hypothetical protein NC651_020960 [Populus alba x Populus x berolinensis]